ncbi:Transcriptional activator hap5 [Cryptotrichosporon argae]
MNPAFFYPSSAGPSSYAQSYASSPAAPPASSRPSTSDAEPRRMGPPSAAAGAGAGASGGAGAGSVTGPFVQPRQELGDFLGSFWQRQMDGVERDDPDFKTYSLPLARIKKVMKSDEEVKMISAEAPVMFSKACEIFISELTCRAWLVAELHKRRTLQKSDVAAAIGLSDMFDFLIDIVPRDGEGEPEAEPEVEAEHAEADVEPSERGEGECGPGRRAGGGGGGGGADGGQRDREGEGEAEGEGEGDSEGEGEYEVESRERGGGQNGHAGNGHPRAQDGGEWYARDAVYYGDYIEGEVSA